MVGQHMHALRGNEKAAIYSNDIGAVIGASTLVSYTTKLPVFYSCYSIMNLYKPSPI